MDTETFVRWALHDARTIEERYTVELLVEQGVSIWNSRRQIYKGLSFEESMARSRERKLNPAYQPRYSKENLRKAVEWLSTVQAYTGSHDRPIRSLEVLRFLPTLETVTLSLNFEATDLSPLTTLPRLHTLALGYPGSEHSNAACRDYTPLARCTGLRELVLAFNFPWPDLTGLDSLPQLEKLDLSGNLLAMPAGATFPRVHIGGLRCLPLAARDVAALPQLPACEFLHLAGAEMLDGIEKMPRLRNLTLSGGFESFQPLAALAELTCLTVTCTDHRHPARQPRDISPLIRLPRLHYLYCGHAFIRDLPRDYAPLAEAPALRELVVEGCPPVAVEVQALQAGLPPCDDLYLAPEPRPLPRLRMVVGRPTHGRSTEHRAPGETGLIDSGLRLCEGRWVQRFLQDHISARVGHSDWGSAQAVGLSRCLHFEIHSFEVVRKLPEILDAAREVIARLRHEYYATFMICLRAPPPPPTPAQQELREQFRNEQDRWEFEQRRRDEEEYIERLHQLELKKEAGVEIDPKEFSPAERPPYPAPPWERESDDDEDDGPEGSGHFAVKKKPDPPPNPYDDDHPLADNYRLMGDLTFETVWFSPHTHDLAVQLMRRQADEYVPDENPS